MIIGKGKGPCDPNQLTKWIADCPKKPTAIDPALHDSTLERQQPPGLMSPETISAYVAAIGRNGGQIGGKRRHKRMTPAARSTGC
jgi:hypothetical protein